MDVRTKLAILADAAKYDASCASSGAGGRTSGPGGIGSTTGTGICHSYTPDGRCISLLKILLTNVCVFDCAYCVNRRSSDVRRARFTVEEVVRLTLDFYKRNYIEGLFLSSGIIRTPDYTMEELVRVARTLRETHGFQGYIHLKTIPEADPVIVDEAGRWADRLSINVELPTQDDLDRLAPEKKLVQIEGTMGRMKRRIDQSRWEGADARRAREAGRLPRFSGPKRPGFAPGGQSTQMIVGATAANDADILGRADRLYRGPRLRRVYYSAFSPIPSSSERLPLAAPSLMREHRLYQADWLMRFYGFDVDEIAPDEAPDLDLEIDPKLAWALRNRHRFPVDVNGAEREALLRVPGMGVRSVQRILASRRWRRIRLDDLARLRIQVDKVAPFVITDDHNPSLRRLDDLDLRRRFAPVPAQLDLFAAATSAASGHL